MIQAHKTLGGLGKGWCPVNLAFLSQKCESQPITTLLTQSRNEGAHASQRPRVCLTGGGQLVSCYSCLKLICFSLWEKLAELPGSTIGFSLLSGELLGGSVHRKRFFFSFFLVVKEINILRGLLKRAGVCRRILGHSPSTGLLCLEMHFVNRQERSLIY